MAEVRLEKVTKRFGDKEAVRDLSFRCRDGEFFFILGPSGAGKTTTLRVIAGLELADEGEIYIGDQLVNDREPGDRNVAMAFETYALYPHLTVFDNLAFPLRAPSQAKRFTEEDVARRVKRIAGLLQIGELLGRMPTQLSGGQKQRVALGRALVREPDVFLLDEPIAHLDAKLRHHMRAELKAMQKEFGTTAIYTTPDQLEALSMADEIGVIREGQLQQIGTPQEIYKSPANRFVASFVGDPPMNFFSCQLVADNGQTALQLKAFTIPITGEIRGRLASHPADTVLLGIRPSDIDVALTPLDGYALPAVVYVSERVGRSEVLTLQLGGDTLKVKVAAGFGADIGQTVYLRFATDKIHLFDEKTEVALD